MNIQAVRGMQDLLPAQKNISRTIEDVVREVFASYGYREIGLPQLEQTELFKRVVGENTDIVEKEMYTFDDRSGRRGLPGVCVLRSRMVFCLTKSRGSGIAAQCFVTSGHRKVDTGSLIKLEPSASACRALM